jgi:hypothetical protein
VTGDAACAREAARLLSDRDRRYALFPSEIFDEYGWNMLLHLFVALEDNTILSELELCTLAHAAPLVGKRWIQHLVNDGQLEAYADGGDVVLSQDAADRLRQYLGHIK